MFDHEHKTTTHTPGDLQDFVAEIFASLVRKDQRATSSYYLQELMLEGRRKSMQPMGERLGIDHQRLQQFVSTSPWPVEPVRKSLANRVISLVQPDAWVVDDTGFVKDGSPLTRSRPAILKAHWAKSAMFRSG
ncbi:hypothetical protein HMPREF0290_0616 [Corynebacterium efficiens YS-314]|nr:transposase [Corynebacterium efficiens]EEW50776.1 hypothetical protein HMPREF0290_0616 [Corynebacterium efficiens YS-314]